MWLGSYSTPVAAARAYDTAVYYLRGPSARLNFPDLLLGECRLSDLSAASIRKKAIEVGARVDALETAFLRSHTNDNNNNNNNNNNNTSKVSPSPEPGDGEKSSSCSNGYGHGWVVDDKPDLNKVPEPQDSDKWDD